MKCEICGRELSRLGRHIVTKHNMSLQQYYDAYLKKDNEDICPACNKKKPFGRDLVEGYNDYCSPICAVSSKEIQEKMRKTCLKNHGVENPLISEKIKISGMMEKHGVEYSLQNKEIQKKQKQTLIDRYGVDHPSKIDFVKQKKIDTETLHFGDLYCRTPEARLSYRNSFIQNIEDQKGSYRVRLGKNETLILDSISEILNIKIERSYRAIGYYLDGYIPELNIALEIDELHHTNACYIESDKIRQIAIENHLKCTFIRISEREWLNDKASMCEHIKSKILEIKGTYENIR